MNCHDNNEQQQPKRWITIRKKHIITLAIFIALTLAFTYTDLEEFLNTTTVYELVFSFCGVELPLLRKTLAAAKVVDDYQGVLAQVVVLSTLVLYPWTGHPYSGARALYALPDPMARGVWVLMLVRFGVEVGRDLVREGGTGRVEWGDRR
ncbi:hypothetical protein QBC40DRAFT_256886 [Triangularia verruculosa]|uniref:Uncharacterized protein n=1 Tax=Triangularia verruculosa TaxID=2587418 RepID=A0AAN7ASK1_9PEZI|nr:hypothetical protein QBC40DRAFT_256886 [Triangularia verruculosa]